LCRRFFDLDDEFLAYYQVRVRPKIIGSIII
jgi:hypothetical protein